MNDVPLSSSDLIEVAKALELVELGKIPNNPILGRIEVIRPDSDPGAGDVVGYFVKAGDPGDYWYGFEV